MDTSPSDDRHATPSDDEDDDYEEPGGGNSFLGFLFGNVDDSGDLDADYLDEDAKEHLFVLANDLHSLSDIDLSKSSSSSRDASEKIDFNEKAEDAVDYKDINEAYDGPEVENSPEDKNLVPKEYSNNFYNTDNDNKPLFDDENYDEDEDTSNAVTVTKEPTVKPLFDDENYDEDEDTSNAVAVTKEPTVHTVDQKISMANKEIYNVGDIDAGSFEVGKRIDIKIAVDPQNYVLDAVNSDKEEIVKGSTVAAKVPHQSDNQDMGTTVDQQNRELDVVNFSENEETLKSSDVAGVSHQPDKQPLDIDGGNSHVKNDILEDNVITEASIVHCKSSGERVSEECLYPVSPQDASSEDSDSICLSPMGKYDGFESEDCQDITERDTEHKYEPTLPVLCVEDGNAILRFSEIFGVHEPMKKAKKNLDKHCAVKGSKLVDPAEVLEDDEALVLRSSIQHFSKHCSITWDDIKADMDHLGFDVTVKMKDLCLCAQPLDDTTQDNSQADQHFSSFPELYPLEHAIWEDEIIWGNSPPVNPGTSIRHEDGADVDDDFVVEQNSNRIMGANDPYSGGCYPKTLRNPLREGNTVCADLVGENRNASCNVSQRYNKLCTLNRQFMDGSWLDNVIWDPTDGFAEPKLILDLQDQLMLFEVLDEKAGEHICTHAGAMIITQSAKRSRLETSGHHNSRSVHADLFNISNDQFYSNRKTSQQVKSQAKKRASLGVKVVHSTPALKLQTMKLKLSNKEIANFHRPKALWYPRENEVATKFQGDVCITGFMKVILLSLGGKGVKLQVSAEETLSSVKVKVAKKLDFKPTENFKLYYNGIELEDGKTLAVQNVRPNSVLSVVCSKIHLWPRAQKVPGENKPVRPPGAFKKKSDLSVKDGHVFLMEYWEERPLLLGNVGMGAKLCTYYQKIAAGDQTASLMRNSSSILGTVVALDPSDKSPFLGEIGSGCSQSSLETNMCRAPIFSHKIASFDYLLVRSAKGMLSLRRIDKLYVVGQQEPHVEVFPPGAKNVQNYLVNRLLAYVYREFRAKQRPGHEPKIRADQLSAEFPNLTDAIVRKRLRQFAELRKGRHGQFFWVPKRDFRIPSEEEIRRLLPPESVCCYESMQASLRRLKCWGIQRLTHPVGLSSAMNQLPDEAITLAAASHIERELQITAWNLTSNFVSCTSQDKENIERLEIKGIGDPSGRGHGFSYVRVAPKAPAPGSVKKKSVAAKGTTVTGTDADLRRLSMEAAREVLLKFDVPEEQIEKLTRWHRIALVRKLSSEHAASGVMVDTVPVSKFARGQRMSFMQLQLQAREKCQEIWDRQVRSLSSVAEEDEDSESDANSDLDSFAGDLEHLLDAEELEDGNADHADTSHEKIEGMKGGLKMRNSASHCSAEEEIEDDKSQAAYILSILEEDEGDIQKNLNVGGIPSYLVRDNKAGQQTKLPVGSGTFPIVDVGTRDPKEKTAGINGFKAPFKRPGGRESLVCGACGQVGHMRTNKNCPKYGEELEILDIENTLAGKNNAADANSLLPGQSKKTVTKITTKLPDTEVAELEKLKSLPVKFKVGGPEKSLERNLSMTVVSEKNFADINAEVTSVAKGNMSFFSAKRTDEIPQEMQKLAPSIVIRPPAEAEKDLSRKKIVIRQPKVATNPEQPAYIDLGSDQDSRKVKRISDISGFGHRDENRWHAGETSQKSSSCDVRTWSRENNARRSRSPNGRYAMEWDEDNDTADEQPDWLAMARFQEARRETAKKKKKKKKTVIQEDYLVNHRLKKNERRTSERHAAVKRRPVADLADLAPSAKRRRGGEVELSNILEKILENLRKQNQVSFLFLKPVTRKEAPDYLSIIDRPMDLSTIREKVRKLEYKNREQFRHDVWQITYNAHQYNTNRNPAIPPLADQLLELCEYQLQTYDLELSTAEEGIEDL